MDADNSYYVKFIATYAPTISVLAMVARYSRKCFMGTIIAVQVGHNLPR